MSPIKTVVGIIAGYIVAVALLVVCLFWLISAVDFGEVAKGIGHFIGNIQQGIEEGKQE